jgi:membrane-bound lytic murein transglycosylase B
MPGLLRPITRSETAAMAPARTGKIMRRLLIFIAFFLIPSTVWGLTNIPAEKPEKFRKLHKMVRRNYSEAELKELFSSPEVAGMEERTHRNLRFLFSPLSLAKQKVRHEDARSRIAGRREIETGVIFFEKHREIFRRVHRKFRVHPADIISILKWESSLGRYTGGQKIIQILAGQYFLWEEYIAEFEEEGAFRQEGAMSKAEAMKRGRRLEKNALYNLAAFLNQASEKNFDPARIRGSRAGAIGYPQFMPASMRFALDGNGDGDIDLFSMPDAIYSVANYLASHRYRERGREYSFRRYNPDRTYVRGVKEYSEALKKAGVDM